MQELRTLLAATDLSPHADLALARAAALARQHAATLVALHVVDHVLGADRAPDNLLRLMFGPGGDVEHEVKTRAGRTGARPVLVVKRPARSHYRQVLVPTDFSDNARQALAAARRVAPDAKYTLLHVYDFTYDPALRTGAVTP